MSTAEPIKINVPDDIAQGKRPMRPDIIAACRKTVTRLIFGPTGKPNLRWQLSLTSAGRAILASWASDNWVKANATKAD